MCKTFLIPRNICKSLIDLVSFQFHQTLENKKDTIKTLKTELAWAMSKQAEMEYEKTCKEVKLQSQKIEKAENLIQKEQSSQRKLENEKAGIEKEVQDFAKVSHVFSGSWPIAGLLKT